ncbi:MAG: NDP-sugar dehydrogenase [Crocinitomicaceae bacterium]|nr:NDP-sugar dehydrogenase [Crocinitomicaceae bacterium]|tara:strand:+ start:1976 stop:3424 length:1449 start_codon:yes stop_codon:yes gene_type:complete
MIEAIDSQQIDDFLSKNAGKKVVAVQGLGFVGAVMSLVCANGISEEYAVIGVDLPTEEAITKINALNNGEFPIASSDPKVQEYFEKSRQKSNFLATHNTYAYKKADVIIIDINLDVAKVSDEEKELQSYDVSLSGFKKAIQSIGEVCKLNVLILVETTVPPGTCQFVVKPIIEEEFEKRGLSFDGFIGHSYERVMPGPKYIDSIQNFYRVYSGVDERSADRVESFLKTIIRTDEYPLTRLSNTHATEMAKVLENSFRAMNISFIQEWSNYAEEAGVNLYEVIQAIRMRPTHKNIMMPGLGVGGYCLTKDPLLASWSKQTLFKSNDPLTNSEKAVQVNDQMPLRAFEIIEENTPEGLAGKDILVLGVSYLNDVGDTRYTPVELLSRKLLRSKANLSLHDPFLGYWEELERAVETNFGKMLERDYDLIVVSTAHSAYRNNAQLVDYIRSKKNLFVLDCWGVFSLDELILIKENNRVKVIGRGDI